MQTLFRASPFVVDRIVAAERRTQTRPLRLEEDRRDEENAEKEFKNQKESIEHSEESLSKKRVLSMRPLSTGKTLHAAPVDTHLGFRLPITCGCFVQQPSFCLLGFLH